jgi:hypothetical protein
MKGSKVEKPPPLIATDPGAVASAKWRAIATRAKGEGLMLAVVKVAAATPPFTSLVNELTVIAT